MSKNDREELDVYVIPPNFIEGGKVFGGMFKLRNVIEAGLLGAAVTALVLKIPASLTVKIVVMCLTTLPVAIFGVMGIEGESLTEFLFNVFKFLKNRRTIYRSDVEPDESVSALRVKLKKNKFLDMTVGKAMDISRKRKLKKAEKMKEYKKSGKKVKAAPDIESYLNIEKIENGIIFTKDERYIKILEIEPINFLLRSAREQRNIIFSFVSYLKVSPVKMQFKVLSKKADINKHLSRINEEIKNEENEKCKLLQRDYIRLIKQIGSREAVSRRFFLIFEYEPFMPTKKGELNEVISVLKTAEHCAKNYLFRCGNEIVEHDNEDEFLTDVVYSLLNRGSDKPLSEKVNDVMEICREQERNLDDIQAAEFVAPSYIDFSHMDYIKVDDMFVSYMMIPSDGYKAHVVAGWMSLLVNAGEGIDVDLFASKQPKEKVQFKLGQQIRINRSKIKDASDTNTDFDDLEGAIRSGYFLKDGLANNEDFFYMNIFITITAANKTELEWRVNEMKKLLVSQDITLKPCNFYQEQAFNTCMPLMSIDKKLNNKTKRNVLTTGLASCYPFTSFEICDDNGILLGVNKHNNSLVIVDIFNSKIYKNANISILGTSGAGKTFTMQLMALRMRRKNIQVFILAPLKGHEFHRACKNIGGEFIQISPASYNCINVMEIRPVDETNRAIIDGETIYKSRLADKIQRLHIFFSLLIPDMSYEEKQLLDEAMVITYERKGITHQNETLVGPDGKYVKMPILGDLYEVLLEKPETKRLANILNRLVNGSAKSFNQQTNVNLDNKYTVLDISELSGDLLTVGMFVGLDYMWDKAKEDVTKEKAIFMDELWQLIGASSNKLAANFVFEIFKIIRGYGGSAIDELIRMGYDEATANKNALFTGYVNTITEKMGYDGKPENFFKVGDGIVSASMSPSKRRNVGNILKNYLKANVSEGIEEIYATVFERLGDKLTGVGYIDENGKFRQRPIAGNEGVLDPKAMGESFIGGFIGGSVMGGVGVISDIANMDAKTIRSNYEEIQKATNSAKHEMQVIMEKAGIDDIAIPDAPDFKKASVEEINEYYEAMIDCYRTILSDKRVIEYDNAAGETNAQTTVDNNTDLRYNNSVNGGMTNGEQAEVRGDNLSGHRGISQDGQIQQDVQQGQQIRNDNNKGADSGRIQQSSDTGRIQLLSERTQTALRNRNVEPVVMRQAQSGEEFHAAISGAKQTNPHGAYVTAYDASDYSGMKTFLSGNGKTGIAVKTDGDIVSVFNAPDSGNRGALKTLLPLAIENGGVKLDNYDGNLSRFYEQYGFEPVAKVKFDPEYAPSDWNYERDGQPDIVFWKHNGDNADAVAENIGNYPMHDLSEVPYFDSYDEAAMYRDSLIEQSNNTNPQYSNEEVAYEKYSNDVAYGEQPIRMETTAGRDGILQWMETPSGRDGILRLRRGGGRSDTEIQTSTESGTTDQISTADSDTGSASFMGENTQEMGNAEEIQQRRRRTEEVAEAIGRKVEWYNDQSDRAHANKNGYYKEGVIHINENAELPELVVLGHETFHSLKAKDKAAIVDFIKKNTNTSDAEFQKYRENMRRTYAEEYRNKGRLFSDWDFWEEYSAEHMENFFRDESFVNRLAKTNKGTVQRILDAFRQLWQKVHEFFSPKDYTSGMNEAGQVSGMTDEHFKQIERMFEKALGHDAEADGAKETYSIAGKNAKNADKAYKRIAERMEKRGKAADDIHGLTGWYRGKDGKWRFEIDDSAMQYRYVGESGKLSDYIRHDELFANYPELRDINVKFEELSNGRRGNFSAGTNTIRIDSALKSDPRKVIIHELQHAIQAREGFETGGNWKKLLNRMREQAKEYLSKNDSQYRRLPKNSTAQEKYVDNYIMRMYNVDNIKEAGFRAYYELYGEQEARATAERLHMTAEERRQNYPRYGEGAILQNDKRKILGVERQDNSTFDGLERKSNGGSTVQFETAGHIFSDLGQTGEALGRPGILRSDTDRERNVRTTEADEMTSAFPMSENDMEKSSVKRSEHENGITKEDVEAIQNMPRKSINSFTTEDIRQTENFARKYFKEMGTKSPFFRTWFGDWRASDTAPVQVVTKRGKARGITTNADTGWDIQISGKVFNETNNHFSTKAIKAVPYLDYINDIAQNAVLLDSYTVPNRKTKSENSAFMHSLYAVADVGSGNELIKLYVEELNDVNSDSTIKRAYQLQDINKIPLTGTKVNQNYGLTSLTQRNNYTVADLFRIVKQNDKNFKPKPAGRVVNTDGTPKVVYHGTGENFNVFDITKSRSYDETLNYDLPGFYFSENADEGGSYGENLKSYYLNMQNPYEGDVYALQKELGSYRKAYDYLVEQGYDGIVVDEFGEGENEYIVFKPEQIKSAESNIGTFDGNNADTRFSVKRSKFYDSTQKTENLTQEMKDAIAEQEEAFRYEGITNKETIKRAMDAFEKDPTKTAARFFAKTAKQANVNDIATGFILMQNYQEAGDYASTVEAAKKLREIGTKKGQEVQAFSILKRLTPEGMVYYAQSELDSAAEIAAEKKGREWMEKNKDKFKLSDEEVKSILDTMKRARSMEDGRQKDILLAEVQKLLQNKMPKTFWQAAADNMNALQRISLLLNPKTTITRNAGGNLVMSVPHLASESIGAAIDKALSKATGMRTTTLPNAKDLAKGFQKGAYESFDDFRRGINTRDITDDRFHIGASPAFRGKNPLSRVVRKLDNITSFALDIGDRPFFEAYFLDSLHGQMKANKVDTPTADMIDIATQSALEKTWQDSNGFTDLAQSVKKTLNKFGVDGFGLGSLVIPFTKTPANLGKALVDFSPVGFTKGLVVDGKRLIQAQKRGTLTPQIQRKFVNTVSKGITGMILYAAAMTLAYNGLISGSDKEDDKDARAFKRNVLGINPYAVKGGNGSWTYDWAQPVGGIMAISADIAENNLSKESAVDVITNALATGGNSLFEQSLLTGVSEFFADADEGVLNALKGAVMDAPSQFVPSLFKQIAELLDPIKRSTYDPNQLKQTANQGIARLPLATKTLEPSVDVLGRDVQRYGGKNNIFNVFLNPGNVNTANPTPELQEIWKVFEDTQDTSVFPKVVGKAITYNGIRYVLSAKERTEYQRILGEETNDALKELMASSGYKDASAVDKADYIKTIIANSDNKARKNLLAKKGVTDSIENFKNDIASKNKYYSIWDEVEPENAEKQARGKAIGQVSSAVNALSKKSKLTPKVISDITAYVDKIEKREANAVDKELVRLGVLKEENTDTENGDIDVATGYMSMFSFTENGQKYAINVRYEDLPAIMQEIEDETYKQMQKLMNNRYQSQKQKTRGEIYPYTDADADQKIKWVNEVRSDVKSAFKEKYKKKYGTSKVANKLKAVK